MKLSSQIYAVTLFPGGAEVMRRAEIELSAGEHELLLEDLTDQLDAASLRVEGRGDNRLQLGAVDSQAVYLEADEEARQQLQRQLDEKRDELQALSNRIETLEIQKKLMGNLAMAPQHPGKEGAGQDWAAIYDLIGAKLSAANQGQEALLGERRRLENDVKTLEQRLADLPRQRERRTRVSIQARADEPVRGELLLRYQVGRAGWSPLYDLRLDTEADEPGLEIVRRASIWQDSGESWRDVQMALSTTRPSGGTSAPDVHSEFLDLWVEPPARPMMRTMAKAAAPMAMETPEAAMVAEAVQDGAAAMDWMQADEAESQTQQGSFHALFQAPGKVSHEGGKGRKKLRLSSQRLPVRLDVRAAPAFDPTAYLYASFELANGPALLPGETALYRDGLYVGKGELKHVNEGEEVEIGFGADDKVQVKRVELAHSKGRHGLIKSENTDERHYRLQAINRHKRPMPVRLFDRIPVARHEKIRVELLPDSSSRDEENVEDRRGVLAFAAELSAGEERIFDLHYRISWPKDERLA